MKKISLLITDDHRLVREAISTVFNADSRFHVIGECNSGEEAIKLTKTLKPDVLIMDINLPGIDGLKTSALILENAPSSKILGISMHAQPGVARQMLQAGVMGYVTKNSPGTEMITAVIEVFNNRKYICNEIKNVLAGHVFNDNDPYAGLKKLSPKELHIISFLKKGYSSKEIAHDIHLSVKTVEAHRYNILKKLKLPNIASLVNYINQSQFSIN